MSYRGVSYAPRGRSAQEGGRGSSFPRGGRPGRGSRRGFYPSQGFDNNFQSPPVSHSQSGKVYPVIPVTNENWTNEAGKCDVLKMLAEGLAQRAAAVERISARAIDRVVKNKMDEVPNKSGENNGGGDCSSEVQPKDSKEEKRASKVSPALVAYFESLDLKDR